MRGPLRWAGTVAALFTAFQMAGCENPTSPLLDPSNPPTEEPTTPAAGFAITSVGAIVPGASVELRGRSLAELTHLSVDGNAVGFQVVSDSVVRFTAPPAVGCDTDGRPVQVVANHASTLKGALRVEAAIRLEVGQSKILSAADLVCLQISAGAEDYLLSVGSFTTEKVTDAVFRLQAGSASQGQSPAKVAGGIAFGVGAGHDRPDTHTSRAALANPGSVAVSAPFDNYAAANVGDLVRMVDWSNPQISSAKTLDELPTYLARVIAVTAGQIFVVDTRTSNLAEFDNAGVMYGFYKAGEIADQYMLRALHAVVDPQLTLPDGAGGRMMNVIATMQASGSVFIEDIMGVFGSSNMFTSRLSRSLARASSEEIARVVIHEAAHLADALPHYRDTGPSSAGWYTEALAVSVEDMAARMGMGTAHQPDAWDLRPDVPGSRIRLGPSPSAMVLSPWGPAGSPIGVSGLGAYDRGARILRYAQEKAGELSFDRAGTTLHQRMMAQSFRLPTGNFSQADFEQMIRSWNVEALARTIGMTSQKLLEESMMADLTDDIVPAEAAVRFGLPQSTAWNQARPNGNPLPDTHVMQRGGAFDQAVQVPAGGYAYWYIPAGGGQGVSMQASGVGLTPHHQVRLTRLR